MEYLDLKEVANKGVRPYYLLSGFWRAFFRDSWRSIKKHWKQHSDTGIPMDAAAIRHIDKIPSKTGKPKFRFGSGYAESSFRIVGNQKKMVKVDIDGTV
jgi:hypothetical protein